MLRNSKQRAAQMVVVFYHLTLKNHIYLPGLVMIDIVDSLESSNKFVPIKNINKVFVITKNVFFHPINFEKRKIVVT